MLGPYDEKASTKTAECHLFIILVNVIMMSVIMLTVILLNVLLLSVTMPLVFLNPLLSLNYNKTEPESA